MEQTRDVFIFHIGFASALKLMVGD